MNRIEPSELILNPDGSIFHLHLQPEHVSDTIILVGDPDRVKLISGFFDSIEVNIRNREFLTHTGSCKNKRLTVISTGIGTDNIDIVINELDALVNIDLKKRIPREKTTSLNLIRIGTSGAIQKDIPIGSFLLTKTAIGFDGLLNFYANRTKISDLKFEQSFTNFVNWQAGFPSPYVVKADEYLLTKLKGDKIIEGVTISAPGFYGPQGRVIRLHTAMPDLNRKIVEFEYGGEKITNYEMESSAIYGLAKLLGHRAVAICAIIANRASKEFSSNYKPIIKDLIEYTLDRIIQ